jgi:hypothetical protein
MELKTARLTILIDPAKKQAFEALCRTQDMTPSQVVRRLIRDYMEQQDDDEPPPRRAPARSGAVSKSAPRKAVPAARKTAARKSGPARKSR